MRTYVFIQFCISIYFLIVLLFWLHIFFALSMNSLKLMLPCAAPKLTHFLQNNTANTARAKIHKWFYKHIHIHIFMFFYYDSLRKFVVDLWVCMYEFVIEIFLCFLHNYLIFSFTINAYKHTYIHIVHIYICIYINILLEMLFIYFSPISCLHLHLMRLFICFSLVRAELNQKVSM